MVAGVFVNANGMTRCWNCLYRHFVLVAFLHADLVIGIPGVLFSISENCWRGYLFFTKVVLRAQLSTHSRSLPSFFFTNEISATTGWVDLSQLLVLLALFEIP